MTRLRTYHREFFPGVALYLVTVLVTAVYVGDDASMPKRLLLLLALLPALWSARAIVRALEESSAPVAWHDRSMTSTAAQARASILDLRRADSAVVLLTYRGDW